MTQEQKLLVDRYLTDKQRDVLEEKFGKDFEFEDIPAIWRKEWKETDEFSDNTIKFFENLYQKQREAYGLEKRLDEELQNSLIVEEIEDALNS